ncbi:MAG: DNA replication/repair protein RecF [Anaerovoracaceae bacterium]|jgi:DNA replication and repair protein RecF
MHITRLELKNFRNYPELSVSFDPKVNIIIGRNAQGKTNLIEAIYLTSIGRSFRASGDREMIRFGEKRARVHVECAKEVIDTKVDITIDRSARKFIRKDGRTVKKLSELLDNIIIVVFSPEDLKLVKEEPEKRRRFIDRELGQIKPAYYNALSSYKKALLQRNAYLKEDVVEDRLLDLWDEELLRYSTPVIQMRKEFIGEMDGFSSKIHERVTNGSEKLSISYAPNIPYDSDPEKQRQNFEEILTASRETDRRLRTTHRGPHKDDMTFTVNGIDCRSYGSQGQQRTAALSLKLAVLDFIRRETGEEGILLLDDVMSELDAERRKYLISALDQNQIFITTTEIDDELRQTYPDANILQIENGTVVN